MSRILSLLVAGAFAQQVLEESKGCPAGFDLIGKNCVQVLTIEPTWICPTGTSNCETGCKAYFPKIAECPTGFTNTGSQCQRVATVAPITSCPTGYVFTEEGCLRQIELPCSYACPVGAVAKGDTCYAISSCEPEHACPPGSTLSGSLCIYEETYDCTPAVGEPGVVSECSSVPGPLGATQSALLRAKAKFAFPSKENHGDRNACEICNNTPCGCDKSEAKPKFIEETLVSAKCKRISVEPANKLCPDGRLDGKSCLLETAVDAIVVPGGFAIEVAAPSLICPAGFAPETLPCGTLTCVRVETAPVLFTCPCGTEDLGDRCAQPAEPRLICPEEYHLANGLCSKTITVEPLTEFTVRYSCLGKECAGNCGAH